MLPHHARICFFDASQVHHVGVEIVPLVTRSPWRPAVTHEACEKHTVQDPSGEVTIRKAPLPQECCLQHNAHSQKYFGKLNNFTFFCSNGNFGISQQDRQFRMLASLPKNFMFTRILTKSAFCNVLNGLNDLFLFDFTNNYTIISPLEANTLSLPSPTIYFMKSFWLPS